MEHVIIGNSAAGLSAAVTLKKLNKDAEITIISDEPHPAYLRCMLIGIMEGKKDINGIQCNAPDFYEANGLNLQLGIRAETVLPDNKSVQLADGNDIHYDRLLVATGATHVPLGIENENIKGVFPFRTIEHAKAVADIANKSNDAMIIGAGLTGLRVAQALNRMGLRVTVVDKATQLLVRQLDPKSAGLIENELRQDGIRFIFNSTPDTFIPSKKSHMISFVRLDNGKELKADLVIIGAGVRPMADLVKNAGGNTNLGVQVDDHLKTTLPDVFAAGDCIEIRKPETAQAFQSALWPLAVEQGRIAAHNMLGISRAYQIPLEKLNATQFGKIPVVAAGNNDSWDESPVHFDHHGIYRRLFIKDDYLVGYVLMGDINRAGVYTEAVRQRTSLNGLKTKLLKGTITIYDLMNLK